MYGFGTAIRRSTIKLYMDIQPHKVSVPNPTYIQGPTVFLLPGITGLSFLESLWFFWEFWEKLEGKMNINPQIEVTMPIQKAGFAIEQEPGNNWVEALV